MRFKEKAHFEKIENQIVKKFREKRNKFLLKKGFKKLKTLRLVMNQKKKLALTFRKSNDLFRLPRLLKFWINSTFQKEDSLYNSCQNFKNYRAFKIKSDVFSHLKNSLKDKKAQLKVFNFKRKKVLKIKKIFIEKLEENFLKKRRKREKTRLMKYFLAWKE